MRSSSVLLLWTLLVPLGGAFASQNHTRLAKEPAAVIAGSALIPAAPLREWPTPASAEPATAGPVHHSHAPTTAINTAAANVARPVSRRALLQQLQQGCEHTLALTSRLVCRGARLCDTLVPGGGASPLPGASPTPPPAIIQTSTDGAADALPGTDSAVAPGPPATPDDADGAAEQQAQQVVPFEADVPPADEGASPLLAPTEGPQPSTGPATDDQPQELPGNAVPLPIAAPPAPAITPAQPPAPVDGLLVPYCVCQQLCADVIAGRYGRHANTFCAADLDPQQPSTWFISVQGWGRAVCHNPPLNTLADSGRRSAELARTPFAKPGGRPPKRPPPKRNTARSPKQAGL